MKIGAVSLGWSGTPLPQVFERLAAMGGECVEINGNTQHHHGVTLEAAAIPQVRAWAAAAGLTIGCLSGYCDFAQTDAAALDAEVERLLVTCRAAAAMEVPIVRAFVGDVKPGLTWESVRPHTVQAFRKAAAAARALGVTLGIENHGRLVNDGPALVELVQEVGAPNLGFTIDTGNFAWAGHRAEQVGVDFEAMLPHIVNVHVKDGLWMPDGFAFVPAGEGALPLAWLLERLHARGYAGSVCSEFEGASDFAEGTRRSIAHLNRLRDALPRSTR
jgi:sugar phosphate isomerase/epimerase